MSERKWTPGKWSVYEVERETYWPGIDAGRTSIVVWGDQQENNGVQGDTLEEAKANAQLIAAAPDLYEALEQARDTILELINARNSEAEGSDEDWVGGINAALSKARGENQ